MADKVQLTLETLVPEMDILVQKGYFTKKDTKKIMKKRRFYEYQFEKTDVMPLDYFKAIKYEKVLHKRMKQQKKNLHIKKNDYYDFHFIRRIIVLYKKCLIKFNNNAENIWMEYFNFLLVNKCNDILNKEIGRCLTLHPTVISFWKIAAYHEYEDNLNFQNARSLLQKCIKFNPYNLEAYLEYFTFELIFAKNFIERKNILSGQNNENNNAKKKMNIIDDVNNEKEKEVEIEKMDIDGEKNVDNDKNKENNNGQIKDLVIPELIYLDTIKKLINDKKNNINEILDIHFGFFERLEKYGTSKQLNYKKLETKIIDYIKEILTKSNNDELFCIDNLIKIAKIKLLKYSKEELLTKIKIVYKEFEENLFIEKYKNYYNYISYHFLNYFLTEEEKSENNDSLTEELIKTIKPNINISKLNTDILLYNNIKLLLVISSKEYLLVNLLQSNNYNISDKIFEILEQIMKINDINLLKDGFIILNNIKNELELIIEHIAELPLKFEENENCYNFMKYYIEKIIELISDEVTYYLKPEIMKNYFEKINNQFIKGKANYILMKELYKKMIELIVDKSIQVYENDKNEDGEKYYKEAYNYIKEQMEKILINRKDIIKDIINKKKNNNFNLQFLDWIK